MNPIFIIMVILNGIFFGVKNVVVSTEKNIKKGKYWQERNYIRNTESSKYDISYSAIF